MTRHLRHIATLLALLLYTFLAAVGCEPQRPAPTVPPEGSGSVTTEASVAVIPSIAQEGSLPAQLPRETPTTTPEGTAQAAAGEEAAGQSQDAEPLVQIVTTTPGVAIDPHERILYMVIPDRFDNGDPSNDGESADREQVGAFHGGDLAGLTGRIPYLVDLGINTLWITPIVKQIERPVNEGIDFDHWPFHGYWAEDFENLEPRLGTPTELARLLQTAHQQGVSVLLDVVLNHPGYHSHWTADPAWTRSTEAGTCVEGDHDLLTMCLMGLPDFRTEDPAVAAPIVEWQAAWFANFPFDGLRADTVKHVDLEVWRAFLERVRQTALTGAPSFFTLGEYWGSTPSQDDPYLAEGMFDAFFDFEFYELVEGFLNGRLRAVAMGHHLNRRNQAALGRYVHFLNTHDTPTMTDRLEDPRAYELGLVFLFTVGGIPMLYYGDELGRHGGDWPHNRPDMPWQMLADREATPWVLTRNLIALRKAHRALTRGTLEVLQAEDGLLVLERSYEGERLVVIYNRGPEDETLACADLAASCELLLCHRCLTEGGVSLTVQPFGAAILTSPQD
ncbi:MAG: hypothetical protein JW797_19790 [Bradymonadales bacterium]|nr:hypothetical protein [Bradymonadales bacterium]